MLRPQLHRCPPDRGFGLAGADEHDARAARRRDRQAAPVDRATTPATAGPAQPTPPGPAPPAPTRPRRSRGRRRAALGPPPAERPARGSRAVRPTAPPRARHGGLPGPPRVRRPPAPPVPLCRAVTTKAARSSTAGGQRPGRGCGCRDVVRRLWTRASPVMVKREGRNRQRRHSPHPECDRARTSDDPRWGGAGVVFQPGSGGRSRSGARLSPAASVCTSARADATRCHPNSVATFNVTTQRSPSCRGRGGGPGQAARAPALSDGPD